MALNYKTSDGDTLDYIAWKHYGTTDATEQLMEANRAIADMTPILPANVLVVLPDLQIEPERSEVRLWD